MAVVPTTNGRDRVAPDVRRVVAPTALAYQTQAQQYISGRGVTEEAFGAALAQSQIAGGKAAVEGAGKLLDLATKIQDDDNVREAKRLNTEFDTFRHTVGFGDGKEDGNRGYYGSFGEDAVKGASLAKKSIADQREKMLAAASNDRVRELFRYHSDQGILSETQSIDRHQLTQRISADDNAANGRIAAIQQEAASKYNDPDLMRKAMDVTANEVLNRLEAKGIRDPDAQAEAIRQARAPAIQNAFNNAMAKEDIGTAAAILGGNELLLPATIRAQMNEKLKGEVDTRAAQIIADQTKGMSPDAAREFIKTNTTGKVRNAALAEFERGLSARRSDISFANSQIGFAQSQADRKAKESGQKLGDKANDLFPNDADAVKREAYIKEQAKTAEERNIAMAKTREDQATRERVRDLAYQEATRQQAVADRELKEQKRKDDAMVVEVVFNGKQPYESLPFEVKQRLDRETIKAAKEFEAKGAFPAQTTPEGYAMIANFAQMSVEQRQKVNILAAQMKMSERDFNIFKDKWAEAQAGKGDDPKDPATLNSRISNLANQLKLSGTEKTDDRGAFFASVQSEIAKAQKAKGNTPLTWEEEEKILTQAMKNVVEVNTYGGLSSKQVPAGAVPPADLKKVIVPPEDRAAIQRRYREAKRPPPTEDQIREMYLNAKRGN